MFGDFPSPNTLTRKKNTQKPEAPSRPVLVMRWESEEETERWFHHLEAAVRTPALSVREMLKDMALSTLVMVKLMTKRQPPQKVDGVFGSLVREGEKFG